MLPPLWIRYVLRSDLHYYKVLFLSVNENCTGCTAEICHRDRTSTDRNQAQKFAQSVYKLQFTIYQPRPPSSQLLPVLAFSRLCFFHSSRNSCLLRRLSQSFVPADTDSSFSNLSGSLALTSLSQGVI